MKPLNKEIYVLGLFPPFEEDQELSDAKFMVIVEKVTLGQNLAQHVNSYVSENIIGKNSESDSGINYRVVSQESSTLSGNSAIALITEKRWGWNAEANDYDSGQRMMRIFTVEDDRVYVLQYAASTDIFDNHLTTVDTIASSFKITATGLYKTIGMSAAAAGVAAVSGFLMLKARRRKDSLTAFFVSTVRRLLPAALGIEILCISAAEIGGNSGLYLFGYNAQGIVLSYALVYALAGFTTFAVILGRYRPGTVEYSRKGEKDDDGSAHKHNSKISSCDCCSILEDSHNLTFLGGLKHTLAGFARGLCMLVRFYKVRNKCQLLRTTLILLVTAESGCILTAATVDIVLYQYSLFISVPLSLAAGTFAVAAPHAFRIARRTLHEQKTGSSLDSSSRLIGIKSLKDRISSQDFDGQTL
jgi:hypothetical protein